MPSSKCRYLTFFMFMIIYSLPAEAMIIGDVSQSSALSLITLAVVSFLITRFKSQ